MHVIRGGDQVLFKKIKKVQTANALELEGKNKRLCKHDARASYGGFE